MANTEFCFNTPNTIEGPFIDGGGKLAIKTGMIDGDILSAEQVKHIALLPSRDELIGKALGSIQSPLYGLVGTLNGLLLDMVGTLAALEQSRADAPAEAEE